ncbi:MAG: hypothetical protein IT198_05290 [Acidimicrobiia bacterium]|nr:hypothetical protein [Acidimicrobiia bacterium]
MTLVLVDLERSLGVPAAASRGAVVSTLRELGFEMTAEAVASFEMRRGSAVASMATRPDVLPIGAVVYVASGQGSASLSIRIQDRWPAALGRPGSVVEAYRQGMWEIQMRLDAALGRLDPGAAQRFAPPAWWFAVDPAAPGTVMDRAISRTGTIGTRIVDRAGRWFEGGFRPKPSDRLRGAKHVVFHAGESQLAVEVETAKAMLGVAVLIASTPGAMPANLQGDVERLAAQIESMQAGGSGCVRVVVAEEDRPIVDFLWQQAELRRGLPVRTLHRCRDCGLEKIHNPDYRKVMMRNNRVRALGGSLGATIGRGGLQPFVLLGTLVRVKDLDPEFVCPRCQGMDSDTRVVTFCPDCGTRADDPALRACAKCGHDFRKAAGRPAWELAATSLPAPPPPPKDLAHPGNPTDVHRVETP